MEKIITLKINELLKKKNLTGSKLGQMTNISNGAIYSMIKGERAFSDAVIDKIVPILEILPEKIIGWMITEKYPKNILERALQLKQEYVGQDKRIVDTKIRELMKPKSLTITAFSKEIGYNQGRLSQVMLGRNPVSPKLRQQLCNYFDFSEDEIKSWGVADKYSLEALQVALNINI